MFGLISSRSRLDKGPYDPRVSPGRHQRLFQTRHRHSTSADHTWRQVTHAQTKPGANPPKKLKHSFDLSRRSLSQSGVLRLLA